MLVCVNVHKMTGLIKTIASKSWAGWFSYFLGGLLHAQCFSRVQIFFVQLQVMFYPKVARAIQPIGEYFSGSRFRRQLLQLPDWKLKIAGQVWLTMSRVHGSMRLPRVLPDEHSRVLSAKVEVAHQ
jgi:hypothetical protein